MNQTFYEMVEENPVIAAVKDWNGLEQSCQLEDVKVLFILFGDLCSLPDIVARGKESHKYVLVHLDLIDGLSPRESAVQFLKTMTEADGIITTRANLIKKAQELGFATVLRYFLIDSMALENIERQQQSIRPDFIEILPGLMPKMITRIHKKISVPIIAGGLISDKESVLSALSAGAMAVSTTKENVWRM